MLRVAKLSIKCCPRNHEALCCRISPNECRWRQSLLNREISQLYHSSTATLSDEKDHYRQTKRGRNSSGKIDYVHPTKTTSFKKEISKNIAPSSIPSKHSIIINESNRKRLDTSTVAHPIQNNSKQSTSVDGRDYVNYQPLVGDYDELLRFVLESFKKANDLNKNKNGYESMSYYFLKNDTVVDFRKHLVTFDQITHEYAGFKSTVEKSTTPALPDDPLTRAEDFLSKMNTDKITTRQRFQHELLTQRSQLCQALREDDIIFNDGLAEALLSRAIQLCARLGLGKPLRTLWKKTKELGCANQKLLLNLLYVAATFGTSACDVESVAAKKKRQLRIHYNLTVSFTDVLDVKDDADDSEKRNDTREDENVACDVLDEIAMYHDLLYEPTEQTTCIRIRMLVGNGKVTTADDYLRACEEMTFKGQLKGLRLRTYTPVLHFYLENGLINDALALYRRMKKLPLVSFDADTYVSLLEGLVKSKVFMTTAPPVVGAEQVGFTNNSGPVVFDSIFQEMADEDFEVSESLIERLRYSFSRMNTSGDTPVNKISLDIPILINGKFDNKQKLVAEKVEIDNLTGRCPLTGIQLQLIPLTGDQKEDVIQNILAMSVREQNKWISRRDEKDNTARKSKSQMTAGRDHLMRFLNYLNTRTGKPYTAIIDGANVGYHNQNFGGGNFSFHQIKFVYDSLVQIGENPLIILPFKYGKDVFVTNVGDYSNRQVLTETEKDIRQCLKETKNLVVTAEYVLDDYFWILASVASQTEAWKGHKIDGGLSNNPNRGLSGSQTVVITNDLATDHRSQFSTPTLASRWSSNYIVHYNFQPIQQGICNDQRISFSPSATYSREIQCNIEQTGAKVWHFPIAARYDKWFCISFPENYFMTRTFVK